MFIFNFSDLFIQLTEMIIVDNFKKNETDLKFGSCSMGYLAIPLRGMLNI